LHLADEIAPSADPPFVAIPSGTRAQVDEFVRYVTEADRLIASGIGISPSLLMFGAPGCGKTLLATHIASRLKLPILVARSDSLISSYLGSTAKNLRALFEHAMGRPCVLFLDEFDAFAKGRDDRHELGELKRVVVSLLQNIDAMDHRTVLIAASNHEHLLDPAVWRRFAYKVRLSTPDIDERKEMLRRFLDGYIDGSEMEELSRASATMNGSQLRHICDDAIRDAVLSGSSAIDITGLYRRIASERLSRMIDFNADAPDIVQAIHGLDHRAFIGNRLSSMFNTSKSTITRRLATE
jgi:SpoVK/Ycf46/Vps4 family AAA+-type ATPase